MSLYDYNTYFLMKEDHIADYVRSKLDFFDPEADLSCQKISDGSLNYIFRLTDPKSGKSLIVKQVSDRLPGGQDRKSLNGRGQIESSVLRLVSVLCPGQVPAIYFYDETMGTIIMEDMTDHKLLKEGLLKHEVYPQFADQISDYLAGSLVMTSDLVMDHKKKRRLNAALSNPDLCQITEDLVLGEPFCDYNKENDIFPPLKDFVETEIYKDDRLKDEAAGLRLHFMNCPQALIHGNLGSGSILINQTHTFVFDPEFACFGPMGYDIGNVLAGLFFALAHGSAVIENKEKMLSFCGWCMCSIMEIVDLFKEKFLKLCRDSGTDPIACSDAFLEDYLKGVLADAAGYAGTECLRRIIGIRHREETLSIENEQLRGRAERMILLFGKDLILNREEMTGPGDYYRAMTSAIRAVDPDSPLCDSGQTILDYDTVALDDYNNALLIIDQTKLPSRIEMLSLTSQKEIWDAIYLLQVRGAPAIGVAAAIGIYLAAREIRTDNYEEFLAAFRKASDYLNSSRPTAVNLSWALKRMEGIVVSNASLPVSDIVRLLHDEALAIREEDIRVCRAIGEYGLSLVKPGDGLLTHCNAGQLATVKYGTATAPMYLGHEKGYDFKIYCDETRPLLQGARLTSFELSSAGMDVTVLCDNMSASLMREGKINAVFTGCDRVAANGDSANKIGTSMAALAARRYGIPFYICAPTSTIDMDIKTGADIVIEQRKGQEVTHMWYEKPMAPEGVSVYNPAFDVTDADLITGIVTEYGVAYPPYEQSLKEIFLKKEIRAAVEEIAKDFD